MPSGTDRYAGVPKLTWTAPDGSDIQYYALPALPQVAAATIAQHAVVTATDRPDLLAARAYGDPLAYWWIANANTWLDPFDMTATAGTVVAIPAPPA